MAEYTGENRRMKVLGRREHDHTKCAHHNVLDGQVKFLICVLIAMLPVMFAAGSWVEAKVSGADDKAYERDIEQDKTIKEIQKVNAAMVSNLQEVKLNIKFYMQQNGYPYQTHEVEVEDL